LGGRAGRRYRAGFKRRVSGRGGYCSPANYVLVIAEKPKAARKIAEALSEGSTRWCKGPGKAGFWLLEFNGETFVVASAVGHLFGLYSSQRGFPVFEYSWRPLWEVDPSASYTKPYFSLLERLSRKASLYVNACDYDIEGSVIGYMIIKWFGDLGRARRAKFSALTPRELRRAFRSLTRLDYEMVEAGLARHELDWLWGINVSRALMESVKRVTGRRVTLSAGRVQSPTLVEIAKRDLERRVFVPLPYFQVTALLEVGGVDIVVDIGSYEEHSKARHVANRIKSSGKAIVKGVRERHFSIAPPYPFNLPDLQAEAARHFRYSPYFTQKVAEELYLEGLISYPRTNSQRLPADLDYKQIVESIGRMPPYRELARHLLESTSGKLIPRNGPKDDPAHPAIYPTGLAPREPLSGARAKIFDLIVRRFLATLAVPAKYLFIVVELDVAGYAASVNGKRIVEEGWLALYEPYVSFREKLLPRLVPGQELTLKSIRVNRRYTRPPEPYSKIKVVRWMESVGIGTESTRARIVELLFDRGYVESQGSNIKVTRLGLAVVRVLKTYFRDLTSVELTRMFEQYLEEIRNRRTTREEIVNSAKKLIGNKIGVFKEKYMDEAGRLIAEGIGLLKPARQCRVCSDRAYADGLCELHYAAAKSLWAAYHEWRRRLGPLTPARFVEHVLRLHGLGEAVRELMNSPAWAENFTREARG